MRGALSVWTGRNGAGTKGIVFTSRVETKSPLCIPDWNEAILGIVPGVGSAPLGNPGLVLCHFNNRGSWSFDRGS